MTESLHIHTHAFINVAGPDLTDPINTQLESIFNTHVDVARYDVEPPASGMTEIAFTIIATGAFGLVFKFFEPLVTAAGEAYRDNVVRLIQRGQRSKISGRRYIPLQIGCRSGRSRR